MGAPTSGSGSGSRDRVGPLDLDGTWRLSPQVALRPEPFGALLYHFGNRRLSFVKDRELLTVVQELAHQPTARAACTAAGVAPERLGAHQRALAALAASDILIRPAAAAPERDHP